MRFHWRLLQGGETGGDTRAAGAAREATGLPDLEHQLAFCRAAERAGISGLLTDVGAAKPDPILLATALGLDASTVEFIVAYRSNFCSPTLFVQQLNTLSGLIDGRLSLNVVAGHSPAEQRYYGDFLPHDERYARTAEWLHVSRRLWQSDGPVSFDGRYFKVEDAVLNTPYSSPQRSFPEIFIGGGSDQARQLAIDEGTLWMRLADAPEKVAESAAPVLAAGKEVGLRLSIVCRPSREEALKAAYARLTSLDPQRAEHQREKDFMQGSDSVSIKKTYRLADVEWLTPWLWTGLVRSHGAPAVAMVGDPEQLAEAFIEYGRAGVSQYIISGWPKLDEMVFFGDEVLPRIRARERESAGDGQGAQ